MTDADLRPNPPDHHPRLVAATLACVFAGVGCSVLALGVMVGLSASTVALAPVLLTLLLIQVPAVVAALVLSILGGMWRSRLDGVITAVLLVTALAANLMLWPFVATQSNIDVAGFGSCVSPFGGCSSHHGTTDLWIGVGVQTLLLALLLTAGAHWLWRLRPDAALQRSNRLSVLATALVFAAVLAAIDASIDPSPSLKITDSNVSDSSFPSVPPAGVPQDSTTGTLRLTDDLGYPVRLVYCPRQNCRGQKARLIAANATVRVPVHSSGGIPDTFVVLSSGNPPACGIVDFGYGDTSGPGEVDMPLSSADPQACGLDVQSLTVPH